MPIPLVSAIVLNYRTPRDVFRCVEGLKKQLRVESEKLRVGSKGELATRNSQLATFIEILLVDNHSGDESIQWIWNRFRDDTVVRVLESPTNAGYAGGNAVATRQARGTYLLIINPDNVLEPGALRIMIDALERDPSIGIIAPKLVHEDGTIRDSARRFPSPLDVIIKRSALHKRFRGRVRRYLTQDEDATKQRDVDWIAGACLLMRKDFYESIGGWDERFFLFFEDIDLCRRCWNAGKRVVYLPHAAAKDRKKRLSDGGLLQLIMKPSGRALLVSAAKYFQKWGWRTEPSMR